MMADNTELRSIHDDVREMASNMNTFHIETAEKLGRIIESQSNIRERQDKQGVMLLDHEKKITWGKGFIAAIGGLVGLVEGWFHGVAPHLKK